VDEALIGLAGIVVGAVLGALGTYFRLRRDAWSDARATGLVLLAAISAARQGSAHSEGVGRLLELWGKRGEVLAKFRRGNYPSGLPGPDWLLLAEHIASLRALQASDRPRDPAWSKLAGEQLDGAEHLLRSFKSDPPVFSYFVVTVLKGGGGHGLVVVFVMASAVAIGVVADKPLVWGIVAGVAIVALVVARPRILRWWKQTGRAPRGTSDA
jgi:hypothetical protein